MSGFSNKCARTSFAIFSAFVACGCSQAIAMKSTTGVTSPNIGNNECFSKAYAAAERSYRKYFKSDWYVIMRATVEDGKVAVITLSVGPYDGTAGGGVQAKYECVEGRLLTLEYER